MSGKTALPQVPPSLKQIASYIQRADELKAKDPVMAYWCTYYAAQMGLDLKIHEVAARDYLYTLIAALEEACSTFASMKKQLQNHDAVENEAAGAAYVENFALRVFNMADKEDRSGNASRSTAKKFLAAANFLELLQVFEKENNARVNDEKVRYAKWKASDIAKAFREGRKPASGGFGTAPSDEEVQALSSSLDTPFSRTLGELSPNGSSAPLPTEHAGRTPAAMSRQLPGDTTPLSANAKNGTTVSGQAEFPRPSVVASKASEFDNTYGPSYAEAMAKKSVHFSPSVVGGMSSTDGSPPPSPDVVENMTSPAHGYFSPHSQPQFRPGPGPSSLGRADPISAPLPDSSPSGSSRTSIEGSPYSRTKPLGRPRSGSSPPLPADVSPPGSHGSRRTSPSSKRLSLQQQPPSQPSTAHHRRSSSASRTSPPQSGQSYLQPAPPGSRSPASLGLTNLSPRSSNISGLPPTAPVPGSYAATGPYKPDPKSPSPPKHFATPGPPPPAALPMQLSPSVISKAQKHCRFAISSLEYEDAEQARKELRAALALLGDN